MTQQKITKPIQSLLNFKINKIKELGIKNFDYFEIKTVYIENETDSIKFNEKYKELLPICKLPYVFIYNTKTYELFFIFSFLDIGRKNFDIILNNYKKIYPFFYKFKKKNVLY